jgi:hypothetical protein
MKITNYLTLAFIPGVFYAVSILANGPHEPIVDAKVGEISSDFSGLAMKYAPEVREDREEKFPMVTAEWIWYLAGIEYNGQVLVQPGKMASTDLSKIRVNVNGKVEPIMRENPNQRQIKGLSLIIPEEIYAGKDKGVAAPRACYAHIRPSLNGKAIDISYIFFNAYNGTPSSGIPGVTTTLGKLGIGHHEGDIEHITVRLARKDESIMGVLYARHGSAEHLWYTNQGKSMDSDDGYKMNGTQIITWSARDTHGNNNKAGKLKRKPPVYLADFVKMIGVLVERTSDGGRRTICRENLIILPSEVPVLDSKFYWMNFRGVWGRPKPPSAKKGGGGPAGLLDKDWWEQEPKGPQ